MRRDMLNVAVQFGIADHLILAGQMSDVRLALSCMDVMLLTSRQEGLPNVLIEAQALGVPVVTTHVGGAPEALSQGRTGWSVATDYPDFLAAPVLSLLRDVTLQSRASADARIFAQQHFSRNRLRQETLTLYGHPTTQTGPS
jgi:glycosyltransferase involved in cell wall biosynthesis